MYQPDPNQIPDQIPGQIPGQIPDHFTSTNFEIKFQLET